MRARTRFTVNSVHQAPWVLLTGERVTQVDFVPERVAQLDAHKLAVPGSFDVLLAVTVRVRVGLKGELGPDGVFSCEEKQTALYFDKTLLVLQSGQQFGAHLPETFSLTRGSATEKRQQQQFQINF